MAANDDNIRAGLAGYAYIAPLGTTAPTSTSAAWGAGWVDLGGISDDGLSESLSQDFDKYYRWGSSAVVRTVGKTRESGFKVQCLETTPYTLSLFQGIPVEDMEDLVDGADTVGLQFDDPDDSVPLYQMLGLDILDGDSNHWRYVIAKTQVTDRADLTANRNSLVQYEITFTPLAGASGSGIHRMYGGVLLPT